MRHNVHGRKFSRTSNQRRALLKGLLNSLLEHDKIKTTEAKAKTLRPLVERMITLARTDTMANRRLAFSRLGQKKTVKRLFETVAPRYAERKGGYSRIVRIGVRTGDAAMIAQIELI
ncbi:MAG: 50S ribosomal protein L17 [Candidatus Wallbacteria bacterium]|nr:50S ribosomal protein L17 [Candidatus Wallbacteria bacterium]MBI4867782.1 50S ribosomal protein L17 [Candidatus Wallbacteria bacterium]